MQATIIKTINLFVKEDEIIQTQQKPVVQLNIEIGRGIIDQLYVYENDDANTLARCFCSRYKLPISAQERLKITVQHYLDSYQQKIIQASPSKEKEVSLKLDMSQIRSKENSPHKRFQNKQPSHSCRKLSKGFALQHNLSTQKQSPPRLMIQKPPLLDLGHRLYYKGMKQKLIRQRNFQENLHEKSERELDGITFKPVINQSNDSLYRNLYQDGSLSSRTPQKSRLVGDQSMSSIQKELKECTFRPRLNNRTKKLSQTTRSNSGLFNRLYQDAQERNDRQKYIEDNQQYIYSFHQHFTFKPQVHVYANVKSEFSFTSNNLN